MDEFNFEKENLKMILSKVCEVEEDMELMIHSISNNFQLDADYRYRLVKGYQKKLDILHKSMDKPYFARIDFQEKDGKTEVCYLSKVGIQDFDQNVITVDWRVPIASLYYDSNVGDTSYLAPEGEIWGTLLKKRQYEIENQKLLSFQDVDTVSNDEILKPYLDVNADNRLKNIVSSIQSEQNQVIRKDISDNMIIQGVAGSGKTTVALHRIAYLAYNHRDKIQNNQYAVIGPNKFFIKYISQVLPDLDVEDVLQVTFLEFAEKYLGEKIPIQKNSSSNEISKFKVSFSYRDLMDSYFETFDFIGEDDFTLNGYKILSNKEIQEVYYSISNDLFISVESKIEKSIVLLSKIIHSKKDGLLSRILNEYDQKVLNSDSKEILKREYDACRREILMQDCVPSLGKYFKILNRKITSLYRDFLEQYPQYKSSNLFQEEDLPGLIYFCYKLKNKKEFLKYRHTVIDEAQDYGEFHFYVLAKVFPNSGFSVFGDLAQSIYDYKSILSWDVVLEKCFHGARMEYLKKSYRTTIEIMEEANRVLDFIHFVKAEPVIRHGEKVFYQERKSYDDILYHIQRFQEKNYSTIAIITSSEEESREIQSYLLEKNIPVFEILEDHLDYENGVCIVERSLAKGLEFDAVLISDASEEKYHSNCSSDMKKLYVSMTRPLHELVILYQDELTFSLQ